MANMSYCRFENTSNDLHDCVRALNEANESGQTLAQFMRQSSDHERRSLAQMRKLCEQFIEEYETLVEGGL